MKVRKRSGRSEEFVREKIVVAIVKAGGSVRRARRIAQQVQRAVSGRSTVDSNRIRSEVLSRLRDADARAYRGWMAYRQSRRR